MSFVFKCSKCGRELHTIHHGLPPYCSPSCEEVDKVVGKGKPHRVRGKAKHIQFGYVKDI